jgi:hypothetical protein
VAGGTEQGFQVVAQGAELGGGDVERVAALGMRGGQQDGVDEVLDVEELVLVVPLADHGDALAVVDPVEEDLEDTEAALAEERLRAQDGDVQPVAVGLAHPLRLNLGLAVGADGDEAVLLRDGVLLVQAVDRRAGDVDDRLHAVRDGGVEDVARAVDVDLVDELVAAVDGQRGRGVADGLHPVHGAADGSGVAHVALHELDLAFPVLRHRRRVEDADLHALTEQAAHDGLAEEAGAAGHEPGPERLAGLRGGVGGVAVRRGGRLAGPGLRRRLAGGGCGACGGHGRGHRGPRFPCCDGARDAENEVCHGSTAPKYRLPLPGP